MTISAGAFTGRTVAVWGAGKSGIAAANLLADLGATVILSDARDLDGLEGVDARVQICGGGNVLAGAELLIPSPGIKPSTPALVAALKSGVQLMSEIELAAHVTEAPIVAISGTDGKSTTTMMIGAIIEASGMPCVVAGNIGIPLSARCRDVGADGVLVAEVSAFQLWSCGHFRPRIAVITNVADDHADYFDGDTAWYARTKARVLTEQSTGDVAILRADDPIVGAFETQPGVQRLGFSPYQATDWRLESGMLVGPGGPIMPARDLPVMGPHNVANALAACAAASAFGIDAAAMAAGLRAFVGLPHRLQRVLERDAVTWIDDSKATNPHAAAVGLRAVDTPQVIITGGFDKGLDLAPFIEAVLLRAVHVIVMGTTADRTLEALAGRVPTSRVETMTQAVDEAAWIAQSGQSVVLSPAASSFDRYRSYAHRGEVYQVAVKALG
ncbi:MAG: UDP-N-acetylmuramoylalanine--D-glutamate ligase [Bradymonadia bacterium]|jgi:UDP-N-acetylmuramoylalanine--D-glutamate ligase